MNVSAPDHKRDLTPDEFVEAFKAGRTQEIEGRSVRGNVSLFGETIELSTRALDVTFWGEVDFSECRFERSLDLRGCRFAKTLNLRNTRVNGSIDLTDVRVRTEGTASEHLLADTRSIDVSGMRIDNDAILDRLIIECGGSSTSASPSGTLWAEGLQVGGAFSLQAAKIDRDVRMAGGSFSGKVTIGSMVTDHSQDDSLVIRGSVLASECQFNGGFYLSGGSIKGNLTLFGSIFDGIFFVRPKLVPTADSKGWEQIEATTIGGEVHLASCKVAYIDWESLVVKGELKLFAAQVGRLRLTFNNQVDSCVFGKLTIHGCMFENDLDLSGVNVTGADASGNARGAFIRGNTIKGDLAFWSPTALLRNNGTALIDRTMPPHELRPFIHGDLKLDGNDIGGEVSLTNLTVSGRIVLDDTRVTRDLSCRSTATALHELRRAGAKLHTRNARDLLVTRARALSMVHVVCENDVDLTGLSLEISNEPEHHKFALDEPKAGNIRAEGLSVAKALILYEDLPEELVRTEEGACAGCHANIPCALDLTGAQIGELMLSFRSFETSEKPADEIGLVLANAELDRFTLVNPTLDDADGSLRVPRPLDLRDVTINKWSSIESSSELPRHKAYESVLNADSTFRRSTYLKVEASLRNRGYDEDANLIYRMMKKRAYATEERNRTHKQQQKRSSSTPFWRWTYGMLIRPFQWLGAGLRWGIDKLYKSLLGYGTAPHRLLVAILLLFVGMQPFFWSPQNYEPSLAILAAQEQYFAPSDREQTAALPVAGKPPTGDEWGWVPGLAISLRYHLPILAMFPRDEWDMKEQGDSHYFGFSHPLAPTPEDLSILIAILNWIAWPFVLAFYITRYVRVDRSKH